MKIIAIGSAFNHDDISWVILQRITHRLKTLNDDLVIDYCGDPGTQLIHLLDKNQPTLLVDALISHDEPGSIISLDAEQLLTKQQLFSSHQLSVANILQLARNIGQLPEQLNILGIAIDLENPLNQQQLIITEKSLLNCIQKIYHEAVA